MRWFRYLTVSEVVDINEGLRDVWSEEMFGVRDLGLVEAAVLRPQQTFDGQDLYPDVHTKAAAMFHSLARTQGFMQGNKRTAFLAMYVFYGRNGYRLHMSDVEAVGFTCDAAEGLLDVSAIAGVLKNHASPRSYPEALPELDELDELDEEDETA